MIAELSCEHQVYADGWPLDVVQCPVCCRFREVIAIECREWKADCVVCRYARWCGQAQGNALTLRTRHLNGGCPGPVMVDYLVHPDNEKRLKKLYSRRVRPRIMADLHIETVTLDIEPLPCAMCGKTTECKCVPF